MESVKSAATCTTVYRILVVATESDNVWTKFENVRAKLIVYGHYVRTLVNPYFKLCYSRTIFSHLLFWKLCQHNCKRLAMNAFKVMMMTQRTFSSKNQLLVWIAASQNKKDKMFNDLPNLLEERTGNGLTEVVLMQQFYVQFVWCSVVHWWPPLNPEPW